MVRRNRSKLDRHQFDRCVNVTLAQDCGRIPIECIKLLRPDFVDSRRLDESRLPASSLSCTAIMSKSSPVKMFVTSVVSLVLLSAGLFVLIGVFGLLIKLFAAA